MGYLERLIALRRLFSAPLVVDAKPNKVVK
jgi:hypothetical protein